MARFNLADYATVQERIEAFWKRLIGAQSSRAI